MKNWTSLSESLWICGKLETKDGKAFANLRVGLGKAQPIIYGNVQRFSGCRGGRPQKQRWEAERQTRATAEEAEADAQSALENAAEQEEIGSKKIITEEVHDTSEDVSSETIEYELRVGVHEKCEN